MVKTLGEQSLLLLMLLLLASYSCMQRFYFRGVALASPSPNRLVVSEPSDAGLIHHSFHLIF